VRPTCSAPRRPPTRLLPRCYRPETSSVQDRHEIDGANPPKRPPRAHNPGMRRTIPTQHPAVVPPSHYNHLRALVAAALIAVVGLTAAVAILANSDDQGTSASPAAPGSPPATSEQREPR
jgi:hypothetical protein